MLSAVSRWLPAAFEAHWLNPLLFSWPIDREALTPFLPDSLEIDSWRGAAYISLVGLRLESARVLGVPAPIAGYDEVNLRFYVRRVTDGNDSCPGVVFVRQIVPHRITAVAARMVYGEPFVAAPVSHEFGVAEPEGSQCGRRVSYECVHAGRAQRFWAETGSKEQTFAARGSLDEFLTARYWGYNGKPGGRTRAYQLARPEWQLCQVSGWGVDRDLGEPYGEPFTTVMRGEPALVLLATGSRAAVGWPARLAV